MAKNNLIEITDSQIVAAVIGGDVNKYALIVERYEAKLLRYAIFIIKDYDMASDLVQEAFIKAYMNLHGFRQDKSFSSWIYRILHNEAMNLIKRNKKVSTFSSRDMDDNDIPVKFSTDKAIDKQLLKNEVQKCLSLMDIKYREVIILYYLEHLKYDEISDVIHIPSSTVGIRIKRAKVELRKICQNNGVKYEQ